MNEKIQGIYEIQNTVNGKRYIGSSVNIKKRWDAHRSALNRNMNVSIKLQRAWEKYGEVSFEFNIIEIVNGDKKELYEREQYYIDLYDSANSGYNISKAAGSCAGYHHTEDAKTRISNANKGENHPQYGKRGEDSPNYGRRHSDESKKKMSAATSGEKHPMYRKYGEDNPNYGKKRTPEMLAKMSEAHKRENLSEETLSKMSEAHKIENLSEETRKKLSASHMGHSPTQETLDKKSESMKIHWENKKAEGERHPNYKKVLSPETRAKMATSQAERRAREKALKTTS